MTDAALLIEFRTQGAEKVTHDFNKLQAGANRIDTQLARTRAAMDKLAATMVRGASTTLKSRNAFEQLENQFDPLIRNAREYERVQKQVQLAVAQGAATQKEATAVLKAAAKQYGITGQAATRMGRFLNANRRAFRQHGIAIQNAGFQLQDFIVQMEMGVHWTRSLGQQLPQLMGAFGPLAAVLGAVAAGFISTLPLWVDFGEDVDDARSELEKFTDAMASAQDHLEMAKTPISELRKEFGEFAEDMQRSAKLMATIRIDEALSRFRLEDSDALDSLRRIRNSDSGLGRATMDLQVRNLELEKAFERGASDTVIRKMQAGIDMANHSIETFRESVAESAEALDMSKESAVSLAEAIRDVNNRDSSLDQIARGARDALTILDQLREKTGDLPDGFENLSGSLNEILNMTSSFLTKADDEFQSAMANAEAADKAAKRAAEEAARLSKMVMEAFRAGDDLTKLNMEAGINKAAAAAKILADNLNISLAQAMGIVELSSMTADQLRIRQGVRSGALPPGAMVDTRNQIPLGLPPVNLPPNPSSSTSKRGGGGKSDAEKEHERLMKAAEKLLKDIETPQETYNRQLEELNKLYKTINPETGKAYINQEQYNRALEQLNMTMPGIMSVIKDLEKEISGEMTSAFNDLITGSKSAGRAILDFVDNVLIKAANKLFQQNVADPFSKGLTGFLTKAILGPEVQTETAGQGLMASGHRGSGMTVNIKNETGAHVEARQGRNGDVDIRVMMKEEIARDIARGGSVGRAISQTYRLNKPIQKRG